ELVTTRTPQPARAQSRRHWRVAGAVCLNALTTRSARYVRAFSPPRASEELSNLADAILEYALRLSRQRLDNRFGSPQRIDAEGRVVATEFCVVALGKLGSRELNYASDIDLMFLFSDEGMTAVGGTHGQVTNREYYVKLAEHILRLVGEPSGEGAAYRTDVRLRPHGREGTLACAL